jgi:hypothetical protein
MRSLPLLFVFVPTLTFAQTPAPIAARPEPTGTVTGHVYCSDTNQPARFAHVSLEAIPDPTPQPAPPKDDTKRPSAKTDTSVDTELDGSFRLRNLKPGNYYVVVEKQGYIKPRDMFTAKQMTDKDPQLRALIDAALPRVKVEANHTETAEVRLERGAAISGTVLYDDGTPAAELSVRLLHKDPTGKWVPLNNTSYRTFTTTDDRGQFRIPSLLGDEYLLETDLSLNEYKTSRSTNGPGGNEFEFVMQSQRFMLPFYGSGVTRQADAAGIKLRGGQELTGQDMLLPISKLHQLTGHVAAGPDSHFVNAASVALLYAADKKELASAKVLREDGLFHFEFVPPGEYILRVSNARDVVWEPARPEPGAPASPLPPEDKERVVHAYGSADLPLKLEGEQLGITATVPPSTKPDTKPSEATP